MLAARVFNGIGKLSLYSIPVVLEELQLWQDPLWDLVMSRNSDQIRLIVSNLCHRIAVSPSMINQAKDSSHFPVLLQAHYEKTQLDCIP